MFCLYKRVPNMYEEKTDRIKKRNKNSTIIVRDFKSSLY